MSTQSQAILTHTVAHHREHSDRQWLIVMAGVAVVQLGCWFVLWRAGITGPPLISLYDAVAIIGLGLALVPFFLWYLRAIHREGETSPLKRIRRDLDRSRIIAIIIATLLASVIAGGPGQLEGEKLVVFQNQLRQLLLAGAS